ncbi:unnamed protein product [Moneuplotes crassus]|uniref:Uncharacterized protein n=1 Tax=Euplotes crassus TaxID=5936 RepID=A0AAD1UE83_EUPCR|nr:unnamed protein product [Moneuplotes crassus]
MTDRIRGLGGRDVSGSQKGAHWASSQVDENQRTTKFRDKKFEGYSELKGTLDASKRKGKGDNSDQQALKQLEDEYILNLQKQIALMEQELKLLKEREAEQNKNANVYKVLLQEGIPVNSDFIALKEKFNDQKEVWDNKLMNQEADNKSEIKNNKGKEHTIVILNHEFDDISDRYTTYKKDTTTIIEDLEHKIFTELNTLDKLSKDREELASKLLEMETHNTQLERLITRNKMFNKKPELMKQRADELYKWNKKINDLSDQIAKKDLELYKQKMKLEDKDLIKKQNEQVLETTQKYNKIEIEINIARSQIKELEGIKKMNIRILQDLYAEIRDLEDENEQMEAIIEPDAMDDIKFLEVLADKEKEKKVELQSTIDSDSVYVEHLLSTMKDEEGKAKDMLDEKVRLENEYKLSEEDADRLRYDVKNGNDENIRLKSLHDLLEVRKERLTSEVEDMNNENEDYLKKNEELEEENKETEAKIKMVLKKIDVNNLLKAVNIDDLSAAAKKNQNVNKVLMTLINKWEQVNIDKD